MAAFETENRAQSIRRWLMDIDAGSADVSTIEREILHVLARARRTERWHPAPIAPFSEPADLDQLVGDLLFGARGAIAAQVARLDSLYGSLSKVNNTLLAELEAAERLAVEATDAIQGLSALVEEEGEQYVWVSDSFNTMAKVDQAKTTALVDTDFGQAGLPPSELEVVQGFSIKVDQSETKGIPGANLLVLNIKEVGNPQNEPAVTVEDTAGSDLAALYDQDPTTWFEIERNFIPPKQRLSRRGRAYFSDQTGALEDVVEVTADLDWKVDVHWPGASEPQKGVPLAEFKDIAGRETGVDLDTEARLVFDIELAAPQSLTHLRLLPMVRPDQPPARVESIEVFTDGQGILLARNVELSTTKSSTSRLEREILRRTGSQNTGGLFTIPTSRNIEKIRVTLVSKAEPARFGLAHPFREKQVQTKTTRKFLGISNVSRKRRWFRIPVSETPATLRVREQRPNLLGAATPLVNTLWTLGGGLEGLLRPGRGLDPTKPVPSGVHPIANAANLINLANARQANPISALAGAIGTKGSLGGLGKALGAAGSFLGKALPVVGGAMLVHDLAKNLFGTRREKKTLKVIDGHDVFKGHRAAVALRDVTLQRINYSGGAELVSTWLSFPVPVSKIGLFVEEDIPEEWPAGGWISYYLSLDGTNWVEINTTGQSSLDQAFVPDEPTDGAYFKAVFRGNPDDPSANAYLKHFALQGLPAR